MTKTLLPPDAVSALREELKLTRLELATLLELSEDAIRKWESGANRCEGLPALFLKLLGRRPDLLAELGLDAPPSTRLQLDAPKGTPEWRRVQRLIGIITAYSHGVEAWTDIRAEENLTEDIVRELDEKGFLLPRGDTFTTTTYAQKLFDYGPWRKWVLAEQFDDSSKIPVMPSTIPTSS